jgi:hypothetical protein
VSANSFRVAAFALTFVGLQVATPALTADANNRFRMGGFVGGLPCPQFLNAMATMRQQGGVNTQGSISTSAAATTLSPWIGYAAGFQTGFNSEAKGVYDIFASLGDVSAQLINVLYATESICGQNPKLSFSEALLTLASRIRPKPTE